MTLTPSEAGRILRQYLEIERAFGAAELPRASSLKINEQTGDPLSDLGDKTKNCQLCGLCQTRTNVVFGSGNPHARLMLVGEAPGFDEDRQGLPFVGAAGQLLTKIIEAMKLTRDEVYIANCLKCRPPNNRNPLPDEIATCKTILMKQIEIIKPGWIIALGKFAAQTLLETETPISRLRGRFVDWNGIRVMPTFHPAYLLRNPADKKQVWQDVQMVMREMG